METDQSANQLPPQPWWQFERGKSGNPSGMTRTRVRTAELFEAFRERHGREPTAGEAVQVRTAGKLAAKCERNRGGHDEDLARMVGHLNRTLRRLGLDMQPAPAKPPPMRPSAYAVLRGEPAE
jgi:hypothetical protein